MVEISDPRLPIAPSEDQYEICVFSAGLGECILIHTGNSEWIVIDSCKFRNEHEPAAFQYLNALGIDKSNIKLVVATHWDDDHILGLSQIVKECSDAQFVMSSAIHDQKFYKLFSDSPVARSLRSNPNKKTGINEYNSIINYLSDNKKIPKLAKQDTLIWRSENNNTLYALSPHDQAIHWSNASLVSEFVGKNSPVGVVNSPKPNYTSIVLLLTLGTKNILLGADLEETHQYKGWSLLLKDSLIIKDKKSEVYKVAHHGSITGHHENIFEDLLKETPICLIAPWTIGGNYLPQEGDLERISAYSDKIHISSRLIKKKSDPYDPQMKRLFRRVKAVSVKNIFSLTRLRRKSGEADWTTEHFGTSYTYL